ncbi:MAG: glycosyltransferase [Planctomycetota bacterium]
MTRVLLVLPSPPLPFGGAAARWFHVLLRGLADRGAEVVAVCCSGGAEDDAQAAALHSGSATLHFFPPTPASLLAKINTLRRPHSYAYSRDMATAVRRLLDESWDFVRFETHFSGWVSDRPPTNVELSVHQLHAIDMREDRPQSFADRLLHRRLLHCERALLRRFDQVSTLTHRLADEVRRIHPAAKVRVTPMTIDPSLYPFEAPSAPLAVPTIGLVGTFRWGPTLSAARKLLDDVWPKVERRTPGTKLLLVGRGAGEALQGRQLGAGVEVHSDVAEVLPYFRRLNALVYLPTVGSGMKVKVMEALALGTPVITNREGAEGLPESVARAVTVPSDRAAVDRVTQIIRGDHPYDAAALRRDLFEHLSPEACVSRFLAKPTAETSRAQ